MKTTRRHFLAAAQLPPATHLTTDLGNLEHALHGLN